MAGDFWQPRNWKQGLGPHVLTPKCPLYAQSKNQLLKTTEPPSGFQRIGDFENNFIFSKSYFGFDLKAFLLWTGMADTPSLWKIGPGVKVNNSSSHEGSVVFLSSIGASTFVATPFPCASEICQELSLTKTFIVTCDDGLPT